MMSFSLVRYDVFIKKFFLVFVFLLFSGCIIAPIPHYLYFAPAIHGEITENGFPVVDADVCVFSHGLKTHTKTDNIGQFETQAIREFYFTKTLIGDPFHHFSMQVVVNGKQYECYEDGGAGELKFTKIELTCDVAQAKELHGNKQLYCA